MAQMLAHPDWVLSHTLLLAGFAALLAGLVLLRGAGPLPARTARWLRLAIAATAVQTFESVLHLFAYVDHGRLVAGHATPLLSTHLAMAVVAHPVFAAGIIGLIVAAAREGVLASPWVAPVGVAGAAAHGLAAPGAGVRPAGHSAATTVHSASSAMPGKRMRNCSSPAATTTGRCSFVSACGDGVMV